MKILHVITSLQIGGAEKLVAEIVPMLQEKLRAECLELREEDVQIDVVAFDNSEPNFSKLLTDKGIKVTFFGKGYYKLSFLLRLAKMMKGYDIVHTHNTSPQYFAAIGSLWLKVSGFLFHVSGDKCPKLVYTEHNTSNRMRTIPGFSLFLKWVYGRYDKNICISDKAEENLREYLSRGSNSKVQGSKWDEKICTIYNGVNVQKFHEAKPIEGWRPKGKTVVVMVAAFRPQKDQKTLIDAFKHLPEEQYELWLVGDGELHDELHEYVGSMQQSCGSSASLGSKGSRGDDDTTRNENPETRNIIQYGNIKFFGNRPDVPELLHTADIVVMSSHYEGLSLSSVEGMSVGKPFIASDVDGLHEVVDGYGILVPHQNPMALAGAIVRLTSDKTYYQQVADKCWERAQMFDIEKMVEGYQKVYESL